MEHVLTIVVRNDLASMRPEIVAREVCLATSHFHENTLPKSVKKWKIQIREANITRIKNLVEYSGAKMVVDPEYLIIDGDFIFKTPVETCCYLFTSTDDKSINCKFYNERF